MSFNQVNSSTEQASLGAEAHVTGQSWEKNFDVSFCGKTFYDYKKKKGHITLKVCHKHEKNKLFDVSSYMVRPRLKQELTCSQMQAWP